MISKQASTVENLKKYKIVKSDNNSQIHGIDEECSSITSQTDFITNEEMLIHVYGDKTSKKQTYRTSKPDNGYYSDTSMSSKKTSSGASNGDTENADLSPGGDYIQSTFAPYFDDVIALQQHTAYPLNDPNNSSSFSQLKNDKIASSIGVLRLPSEGEYVADSMAVEWHNTSADVAAPVNLGYLDYNATEEVVPCSNDTNAVPVDLGYLDYSSAFNNNSTEPGAPSSHDAELNMMIPKPLVDSDSFPYVQLDEDSVASTNSQFGVNCTVHDDTKGKKDYLLPLHTTNNNEIGVYIDHTCSVQQCTNTANTERALLNKADLESSLDI